MPCRDSVSGEHVEHFTFDKGVIVLFEGCRAHNVQKPPETAKRAVRV